MNIPGLGLKNKVDGEVTEDRYIDVRTLMAPRKPTIPLRVLLLLGVFGSAAVFSLGLLAARETGVTGPGKASDRLWIENLPAAGLTASAATAEASSTAAQTLPTAPSIKKGPAAKKPVAAAPSGGEVVAAKTGTKYYLPWCAGAKRIKSENKVTFANKTEAEVKGYTAAKNCKGL